MKPEQSKATLANTAGLAHLIEFCDGLRFEPHDIAHMLDKTGRYEEPWLRGFPFTVRLFHYTARRYTLGLTWHERLELFLPLDGRVRLQMGNDIMNLGPGDLLVVDNLKLHRVLAFRGFNTRVVVISFMPEFVRNLGSPAHDYTFLLPFYATAETQPRILRASEPRIGTVYRTVAGLVQCFFEQRAFYQIGCRAFLLQLLYQLARRFQTSETVSLGLLRRQENDRQLTRLLDHIRGNYAERLRLKDAARMAGMSRSKLTKEFKRVTGMSLVDYVGQVRLSNAARLLREGKHSIGEIAVTVGFADQSYFDRRFREAFGQTPMGYRKDSFEESPGPSRRRPR